MSAPRPPAGLQAAGRKLWRDITGSYELLPDENRMLIAACRTADELERLHEALTDAPLEVPGSKGQMRPNPLFAEVRSHRLLYRQLLTAIGIGEAGEHPASKRSHAGRQLARQRWGIRGAA